MSVSREVDILLSDETEGGEHGGAAVFDFGFAEPFHVKVVGESEGVEANVSYVSGGEGGCFEEGYCFGHFSVEGSGGAHLCLMVDEDDVKVLVMSRHLIVFGYTTSHSAILTDP